MSKIKVITLWQPWASLVANGYKQLETRSWKTDYIGPILIHSAKRWKVDQQKFYEEHAKEFIGNNVPLGEILAIGDLVGCMPTDMVSGIITDRELLFGDYSLDRFVWVLNNVRVFNTPVPWKGRQGLWEVSLEDIV